MVHASALLAVAALSRLAAAHTDLGGGDHGILLANVCGKNAHACSELDDDWPDQGMTCPEAGRDIPRVRLGWGPITFRSSRLKLSLNSIQLPYRRS